MDERRQRRRAPDRGWPRFSIEAKAAAWIDAEFTLAPNEAEPSEATVGRLPLRGDKQKRAALVRTCPRMPILGSIARELLLLGSEDSGRYENRVHPLDEVLVGLPLGSFAELEVALNQSEARVGQKV
jgi:hypothetical protein